MRHLRWLVLLPVLLVTGCCGTAAESPHPRMGVNAPFGRATPVYGVTGSSATGIVSGAATYRSDWMDLSELVGGISWDIAWAGGSGSPAGTLGVEVSNATTPPDLSTAAITLPLANTPTAISGNSGTSGVDAPLTGYRWARLAAVVSAGSFTLTALAYTKWIH